MSIFIDLQTIKIFGDMQESILKKIEAITNVDTFQAGEVLFKENDYAEYLYALAEGRVVLELSINSAKRYRMKDIFPGEAFGISAVVDTSKRTYIADAVAIEKCRVLRWNAGQLEKLFYEDNEMGFLFMRNVSKVLKDRLQVSRAMRATQVSTT